MSATPRLLDARPPVAVGYARVDTPLGPIWMARTASGILRISLRGRSERSFLNGLRDMLGEGAIAARRDGTGLHEAGRQLLEYFGKQRLEFSLPLDLRALTPFQRSVLEATARVPFGSLASYGAIAGAIGRPGASRAVGNALGRNPVPILVPCHRIIASDGTIGGFTGGTGLKRRLLDLEGIAL